MQSYATHRRYYPLFHFFVFPLLAINVVVRIVYALRHPGARMHWWEVIVAVALVAFTFATRYMILRVQDRLIALEQSLRLERCLPDDLRNRIGDLRVRHLVALRFCDDDEVADLTRAVLSGEADTADAIKKRIKTWRPELRPRA